MQTIKNQINKTNCNIININQMFNGTKIIMIPSHSMTHDFKKRPQRKTCVIYGQRWKIQNKQGLSDIGKNAYSWNGVYRKTKENKTSLGKDTPRQENDIRCRHTEENSGD